MNKFLTVLLLAVAVSARAEEADMASEVKALREEVDALKAQVAKADDFQLESQGATLKLGGYAQGDARFFEGGHPGDDTFLVRRARIDLKGNLQDNFGYNLQADFASSPKLINAYVEYTELSCLKLRVGQQKEPFSMEEINSAAWIDFIERSMVVTAFAPQEDIGAAVYGTCWEKRIDYSVGAFNGRGKNQEDTNDDKDLAGRLVVSPADGLYVGVNGTIGEQEDLLKDAQAALKTDAKTTFYSFAPDAKIDGERTRVGADVEWYAGPASVKAEWIQADLDGLSASNATADASFDGWYVGGTWLLTGEKKLRNKGVEPARNFSLKNGGAGAWELAARYQVLNGDEDLLASGMAKGAENAEAIVAGVNWYPNRNVKIVADIEHVTFDDDIKVDGETIDSEDVAMLRFQYSL